MIFTEVRRRVVLIAGRGAAADTATAQVCRIVYITCSGCAT